MKSYYRVVAFSLNDDDVDAIERVASTLEPANRSAALRLIIKEWQEQREAFDLIDRRRGTLAKRVSEVAS